MTIPHIPEPPRHIPEPLTQIASCFVFYFKAVSETRSPLMIETLKGLRLEGNVESPAVQLDKDCRQQSDCV